MKSDLFPASTASVTESLREAATTATAVTTLRPMVSAKAVAAARRRRG